MKIIDEGLITEEEVLATILKHKTILQSAKSLNVDYRALKKFCVEHGLTFKRGRPKGSRKSYAKLIQWIREHPKVSLPRSYKAIEKLTGCTNDEVKTYLYRRRKEVRDYLKALPDLRKTFFRLKSPSGVNIPFHALHSYSIKFDPWNFVVKIVCRLKPEGRKIFHARMSFAKLKASIDQAVKPLL